MKNKNKIAVAFAILAAALYAENVPFSKLLMDGVSPTMMAGLLYIGAGAGIGLVMIAKKAAGMSAPDNLLQKKDLPYTVAVVALGFRGVTMCTT